MSISVDQYEIVSITDESVMLRHKVDQSTLELPNVPEVLELLAKESCEEQTGAAEKDSQSVLAGKLKWTEDATRCLILLYKQHEKDFKSTTKRNDEVWQAISTELKLQGYNLTAKQAEFKWKHLRKLYLKKKENMGSKATGVKPINFQLFEEMDEIYANNPAVNPIALASSSKGSQLKADIVDASFNESGAAKKRKHEGSTSTAKQIKCRSSNEFIEWLEESNKQKEEAQQVRHDQLMKAQQDAVNAFTNIMSKMVDKM